MIREGVPLSIGLQTTGWRSNGDFYMDTPESPDSPNFFFWGVTPDGVYADPCNRVQAEAVGPSAAALADAVALLPGIELVSGPTDVVVGGNPGKQVVMKVPEDIGCPAGSFHLWYDAETGGRWASYLNATIKCGSSRSRKRRSGSKQRPTRTLAPRLTTRFRRSSTPSSSSRQTATTSRG